MAIDGKYMLAWALDIKNEMKLIFDFYHLQIFTHIISSIADAKAKAHTWKHVNKGA